MVISRQEKNKRLSIIHVNTQFNKNRYHKRGDSSFFFLLRNRQIQLLYRIICVNDMKKEIEEKKTDLHRSFIYEIHCVLCGGDGVVGG